MVRLQKLTGRRNRRDGFGVSVAATVKRPGHCSLHYSEPLATTPTLESTGEFASKACLQIYFHHIDIQIYSYYHNLLLQSCCDSTIQAPCSRLAALAQRVVALPDCAQTHR